MRFASTFPRYLRALKRKAQVILPKDFGAIVAYSGIDRDSVVAEGGSGSGFFTVQVARIVKKVYSYELRSDHYELALKNINKLGIDNVVLKNADISDIKEEDLDMIFLDMKDSDKLVERMHEHLAKNGVLVGYNPNIEQAKSFHLKSAELFSDVFTISTMNIEYKIRDFGCRPENVGLIHTGYLTFARK